MKMKIDYFEAKSGGAYRYVHTDQSGNEYGFRGVIHEVQPPERVIQNPDGHRWNPVYMDFSKMPKG